MDFLNNKNVQIGILSTIAVLVVAMISINYKQMGMELAILSVLAVILLTVYMVVHILSNNGEEFTELSKAEKDRLADRQEAEIAELTEQEVSEDAIEQRKKAHESELALLEKRKDGIHYWREGPRIGEALTRAEVAASETVGDKRVGLIDGEQYEIVHSLDDVNITGDNRVTRTGDKLLRTDAAGNVYGVKDDGTVITRSAAQLEEARRARQRGADQAPRLATSGYAISPNPLAEKSPTCEEQEDGQIKCLFEVSTRDRCINRNSYDIRGACHIQPTGPLPAPQPSNCPCDSKGNFGDDKDSSSAKWRASMCRTLDAEACEEKDCDTLWEQAYGDMIDTADRSDKCWRKNLAIDKRGGFAEHNSLMPQAPTVAVGEPFAGSRRVPGNQSLRNSKDVTVAAQGQQVGIVRNGTDLAPNAASKDVPAFADNNLDRFRGVSNPESGFAHDNGALGGPAGEGKLPRGYTYN